MVVRLRSGPAHRNRSDLNLLDFRSESFDVLCHWFACNPSSPQQWQWHQQIDVRRRQIRYIHSLRLLGLALAVLVLSTGRAGMLDQRALSDCQPLTDLRCQQADYQGASLSDQKLSPSFSVRFRSLAACHILWLRPTADRLALVASAKASTPPHLNGLQMTVTTRNIQKINTIKAPEDGVSGKTQCVIRIFEHRFESISFPFLCRTYACVTSHRILVLTSHRTLGDDVVRPLGLMAAWSFLSNPPGHGHTTIAVCPNLTSGPLL